MSPLSDQEREELVAYLDGELDEEQARAIEARIAMDPAYRAEMAALKQAWELLDYLPRAEPPANFTHRTLERLALPRPTGRVPGTRRHPVLVGLAWLAAALFLAAGSFWAVRWLTAPPLPIEDPQVVEQLQEHWRLVKNYPLYQRVDDFEMLQELTAPDLFGDEENP